MAATDYDDDEFNAARSIWCAEGSTWRRRSNAGTCVRRVST